MRLVILVMLVMGCSTEPELPSCKSIGCDGTQKVPLYCPVDGEDEEQPRDGACFCAPDGEDQWCMP